MELYEGLRVTAINECEMEDGGSSLTVGYKYEVLEDDNGEFYILDDQSEEHYFSDEWSDYFKVESGYMKDALRTESTVFNLKDGDDRLLHAGIGLATEAAEFLDALKKHIFYGKELDRVNLKEEIGDLQWYCAIALDELDSTFEEVQDTNIAKLKARYPDKFTEERAEVRDLPAERKILEK